MKEIIFSHNFILKEKLAQYIIGLILIISGEILHSCMVTYMPAFAISILTDNGEFSAIVIYILISNIIIKFQTKKYQNLYHDGEELKIQVQIIDNKKEKQYYNRYKIKVLSSKYKNTYLYMTTKKNLEYGEILEIQGNF